MFKFNKISLNCKNIYCNYLHLNLFILKCTNDILHTFKASVHLFLKNITLTPFSQLISIHIQSINQSINQLIIFRGRVSNEESSFTVSLPGSRRQSRQPRLVFYFTKFKTIQTTQVSVLFYQVKDNLDNPGQCFILPGLRQSRQPRLVFYFNRFKTNQTTQVSVLFYQV